MKKNASILVGIATFLAALPIPLARADAGVERIEISGPIFPKVSVLYMSEGADFPATLGGEETLVADAALTFSALLTECKPAYPDITLAVPGEVLTRSQLEVNYREVAACAYSVYTVKPYWIPKLVDDVSICETQLGSDWHLIAESDLTDFTPDNYQFIADTLTAAASEQFSGLYFASRVFVRGIDGKIKEADLAPDVVTRVTPLTKSGEELKLHYEGGTALRCIRRTSI